MCIVLHGVHSVRWIGKNITDVWKIWIRMILTSPSQQPMSPRTSFEYIDVLCDSPVQAQYTGGPVRNTQTLQIWGNDSMRETRRIPPTHFPSIMTRPKHVNYIIHNCLRVCLWSRVPWNSTHHVACEHKKRKNFGK